MHIYGKFITQQDEVVTVDIRAGHGGEEVEIDSPGGWVRWTSDPVEITSQVNDTFDHILRQSCSIRLESRMLLVDLFSPSFRSSSVVVSRDGAVVFAGYIQPQTYEQSFNEEWDEIEINCIDMLSALQFSKYRNTLGSDYTEIKANAAQVTFRDLISEALGDASAGVAGPHRIWFDGSRGVTDDDLSDEERALSGYDKTLAKVRRLFTGVSVSGHIFIGDSADEVLSMEQVLEQVLRYLNLRVCQDGQDFRIYSWDSVKRGSSMRWMDFTWLTPGVEWRRDSLAVSIDNAASADTTISIGEVFNQFSVTCGVKSEETVLASPLDTDDITPIASRQLYMREYIAESSKDKSDKQDAQKALVMMSNGEDTDYDGAKMRDWFLRVYKSPEWVFNSADFRDFYPAFLDADPTQESIPSHLSRSPGAALLSFGKVDRNMDGKDNSLTPSVNMSTSLVVSVNGNGNDTEEGAYPTPESLLAACPLAEYTGNEKSGLFSPTDGSTTNYIVFSGKITLAPLNEVSCDFRRLTVDDVFGSSIWGDLPAVGSRSGDCRYYMQEWFCTDGLNGEPFPYPGPSLVPDTGDFPQSMEFRHSAVGDGSDTVSKVAVVACMLIIGDKCAVEQTGSGEIGDIVWQTYKERTQCADDEEYYSQCFTLGFNPKIGDKLVGTEFDIQNNVSHTMEIDAEGTAIPIHESDKLYGRVRFMILGPVYTVWSEVTRRHKTWFRKAKWGASDIPLMSHVSSIFLSGLDARIVSDNARQEGKTDVELVYMSDANTGGSVSERDPVEFKITTALTAAERSAVGMSATMCPSMPVVDDTQTALFAISDLATGESGKPEQLYVDACYREHSEVRVRLRQKLTERAADISMFNNYTHPTLPGRSFFVTGISRNLTEGWAELDLKEI